MTPFRAVIFDLGGVVMDSPLHAIAAYERELGIPEGHVNRVVVETGPMGAWSRLERGECTLDEFYEAFQRECRHAGHDLSPRDMMTRIGEHSKPRPQMLDAIAHIRRQGLRTAALTNNWKGDATGRRTESLGGHFDVVIESAVVGLRKPDPRIFELACRRLEVSAPESIFLDDIGRNLKAARAMGMTTIKVDEADRALDELSELLGFPLHSAA